MSNKIAWTGHLRLTEARWTDKDGHTASFELLNPLEDKPNPFSAFTKRRGGRAGTRFHATLAAVEDSKVAYDDEVMLAGWGHTAKGMTVRFWLSPPETGIHTLEYHARGDQFMAVLAEKDDDDQIIDQVKRQRVEEAEPLEQMDEPHDDSADFAPPGNRRGQHLSNVAFMIANTEFFWHWLKEQGHGLVSDEPGATLVLKNLCGIESRKELDSDPDAAARFHSHVRKPFNEWFEVSEQ